MDTLTLLMVLTVAVVGVLGTSAVVQTIGYFVDWYRDKFNKD